jgi:hypothetical protein
MEKNDVIKAIEYMMACCEWRTGAWKNVKKTTASSYTELSEIAPTESNGSLKIKCHHNKTAFRPALLILVS